MAALRAWRDLEALDDRQIEKAVERALEQALLEDAEEDEQEPEPELDAAPIVPALTEAQAQEHMAGDWETAQQTLGTRAGFLQLYKGKYRGFVKPLDGYQLPRNFPDLDECLTRCTWGAVYGQESPHSKPRLFCTNAQHYQEKVERGKATMGEVVRERMEQEAERDRVLVRDLVAGHQETLFRHFALALMAEQRCHDVEKPAGWDDRSLWYEQGTTTRVRELLQVEGQGPLAGGNKNPTALRFVTGYNGAIDAELAEKVNGLDLAELRELTGNLIAYSLRKNQPDPDDD